MKTNLAAQLQAAAANPNDIRGIKPPIDIPGPWPWLWIGLGVLALVATSAAIWYFLRKKKATELLPPPVPPHIRAKQKLAEALIFISDSNRFCTEVSNTLRLYLEERFNLRAPERTTEEFLVELRTSKHLTVDQKQSLGEFLENCDLVKFARFEPNETTLRHLHDAALRLVDETQFDPIGAPQPGASVNGVPPPLPPSAAVESEVVDRKS